MPPVVSAAFVFDSPILTALVALVPAVLALVAIVEAVGRVRLSVGHSHRVTWLVASLVVAVGHLGGVSLAGGDRLHFVGAAWLTLMLGYPRAVLSMSLIVLMRLVLGGEPLAFWGVSLLAEAIAPVWAMWWIVDRCKRWLPANLFVFLIGCGLFGVAAVNFAHTAAASGILRAGGVATGAWGDYLPFGLLLGWGEALLEAMATTVLVVYLPGVVAAFDEDFYLSRPG